MPHSGLLRRRGESLAPDAPLFVSRGRNRLSLRMARTAFRRWQQRAGLDRIHSFHVLRHTACTNLYRKTRDIRLVQRFARHVNIHTTTIYAQPTEEDLMRAVRELPC
jgi:site-specific recombinase XerD